MNALKSVLAAALFSVGLAGVAHARDLVTVRLDQPAQQSRLIVDQVLWSCDGDTCTARPHRAASVRACRQFVREIGGVHVTAFGSEADQLSTDELARCNGGATQQAAN